MRFQTFTQTFLATGAGLARRFVTYTAAQAGAADQVAGVAVTDFTPGVPFSGHLLGVCAVECGGPIAVGDAIIPDAQGRAITDAGNAANRVGRATTAVSAAGQLVFILIK